MSTLRRLRDAAPPTVLGWAVAILAASSLGRWGYGEMDLVVFVVSLGGLILFALSCALVVGAAIRLSKRHASARAERRSGETDTPISTGFSLPSMETVPLVQVAWEWRHPAEVDVARSNRSGRLVERVVARRRALVEQIERRLVVRGVFRLSAIAWRHRDQGPFRILPALGGLRNLPALPAFSSGDGVPHPTGAAEGDRLEIRRYAPGDSIRYILWKTYARTGQLVVRVPERALDRARRSAAYLLASDNDEAAAATARVAIERGLLGDSWIFGADGTAEPTEAKEEALDAVARSGNPEVVRQSANVDGLRAFVAHPTVRAEGHCLLFVAADAPARLQAALDASRTFAGVVSVVLATDGIAVDGSSPWWQRLLWRDLPTLGVARAEVEAALAACRAAGVAAAWVDRPTGRLLGGAGLEHGAAAAANPPASSPAERPAFRRAG
ncbi:MAG: DUF58 domain-containing protein [Acidobacteriota bacterium]